MSGWLAGWLAWLLARLPLWELLRCPSELKLASTPKTECHVLHTHTHTRPRRAFEAVPSLTKVAWKTAAEALAMRKWRKQVSKIMEAHTLETSFIHVHDWTGAKSKTRSHVADQFLSQNSPGCSFSCRRVMRVIPSPASWGFHIRQGSHCKTKGWFLPKSCAIK